MSSQLQELIRVPEATNLLDVSESTVRRLVRAGRLVSVRVGLRAVRIRKRSLDAVLAGDGDTQASPPSLPG